MVVDFRVIIYRLIVLVICSIALSGPLLAEPGAKNEQTQRMSQKLWHYLTDGASITAGAGGRQMSVEVTRAGTDDRGKLVENDENAWFLSYNTRASYFANSMFGYSWMFNLSSFELHQQETAPEVAEDLGSRVEGYFAYAIPAFFYNLGDKYKGTWLRTGIGLGMGVAEFDGDIILTESKQANDRVDISNGASKIFIAVGLFVEAQVESFTFRIAIAGPNVEYKGYNIGIGDTSLMLGYTHYLE